MLHRGGIEVYTNNNYQFSAIKLYHNNAWVDAVPYLYINNGWTKCGAAGTSMDFFITSNSQEFKTVNDEFFLVRRQ